MAKRIFVISLLLLVAFFTMGQQVIELSGNFFETIDIDSGTADFDSLTSEFIDLPETANEDSPQADYLRIRAVEDQDFVVLETVSELGEVFRINQDTYRIARNATGASVAAGKAVRFSGSTGNKPNFLLANANEDSIAAMPAVGITTETVADNAFGIIMLIGRLTDVKTNYAGWTEGTILYVNDDPDSSGFLTHVKPGHAAYPQWIGTVEVVSATVGIILINTQAMVDNTDDMLAAAFPDSANNPRSDVDINGGAIDGTPIGANSASTGAFTHLSASDSLRITVGAVGYEPIVLRVNGVKVFTVSQTGQAYSANSFYSPTNFIAGSGSASSPTYTFHDLDTGIYFPNAIGNQIGISAKGAAVAIFDSSGVDVTGDLSATTITLPVARPAAPAAGTIYLATGTDSLYVYNGSAWRAVLLGSP